MVALLVFEAGVFGALLFVVRLCRAACLAIAGERVRVLADEVVVLDRYRGVDAEDGVLQTESADF